MDPTTVAAPKEPDAASRRALREPACPLCGGANHCAPAVSGNLETPCWCSHARFTPELLARVQASGGRGCICARCAADARAAERVTGERTAP
jgi:hypothetical protein